MIFQNTAASSSDDYYCENNDGTHKCPINKRTILIRLFMKLGKNGQEICEMFTIVYADNMQKKTTLFK